MARVLALVSFRIFPTHMGGQKGVALFYKYLKTHTEVFLAVSRDNVPTNKLNIQRTLFPNKKMYLNIFKLKELKKIVQRENTQVIIAEHSYAGWIAWLLHKATGKPFIIHSHNIESRRFRKMHVWWWPLYSWYEGMIHRKAHHNFFISEEDLGIAKKKFRLSPALCSVITYGIERRIINKNKVDLKSRLGLDITKTILLFNGTLDYKPNYDAVVNLISTIDPLLQKKIPEYQIVITGNRAPKELIEKMLGNERINYLGYVADVDLYYQAADIFLNPVANNSGVKTKLIEAIANNCTAISTVSGAAGIPANLCGEKLVTIADGDWNSFVLAAAKQLDHKAEDTPEAFYDYYDWKNIASKASEKINELVIK